MFSLESLHRGDSNQYTKYTIINMKKITLNYPKYNVRSYWFSSWELQNEFETAVVNEPSMFEPLKFYCIRSGPTFLIPLSRANPLIALNCRGQMMVVDSVMV